MMALQRCKENASERKNSAHSFFGSAITAKRAVLLRSVPCAVYSTCVADESAAPMRQLSECITCSSDIV